jgi:hypothetical protein
MPILNHTHHTLHGSHYGFSATTLDELGSTEYTLVTICADVSGSVYDFITPIEECLTRIVQTCASAPRSDYLLLRVLTFNDNLHEIHGFKPIIDCQANDYMGQLKASGSTALYDAAYNGIASIASYGEQLAIHDFDVNGIVFVITDGSDNSSRHSRAEIRTELGRCISDEHLDSMFSVLIGVNVKQKTLSKALKRLKKEANFDEYIELDNAQTNTLYQLAKFVSKSINLQSQALGTGQSPINLSF